MPAGGQTPAKGRGAPRTATHPPSVANSPMKMSERASPARPPRLTRPAFRFILSPLSSTAPSRAHAQRLHRRGVPRPVRGGDDPAALGDELDADLQMIAELFVEA